MEMRFLGILSRYAAAIALFAVSSNAMAAMVAVPGVFNTGVDNSGTPLVVNAPDTHYTVTTLNVTTNPITLRTNSAFPLTAYTWKDDGIASAWVTAGSPPGYGSIPGTYSFVTTFDLTGFSASTTQIGGKWSSDNDARIFLNNIDTGITTSFAGFNSAPGYTMFSIFSGVAPGVNFAAGLNTLEFRVTNGGTGSNGNPVALRVEMNATAAPVPLPAAAWLLLSGLVGFAALGRRKVAA